MEPENNKDVLDGTATAATSPTDTNCVADVLDDTAAETTASADTDCTEKEQSANISEVEGLTAEDIAQTIEEPSEATTSTPVADKKNMIIAAAAVVVAILAILIGIIAIAGTSKDETESPQENPSVTQKTTKTTKRTTTTTKSVNKVDLIEYISDRSMDYYEDKNKFILFFALKDEDYTYMSADGTVAITITNDNGEKVYSKSVSFDESDFSMWNSAYYGERYMIGIDIFTSEITPGTIDSGKVTYKVTLSNGMWFSEGCEHTINDHLPVKSTTIEIPTLPITLHEYDYNDNLERTVVVTDMRYEIDSYNNLYVYFSGEKTFDEEGDNHGHTAYVSYTLYDSEGYVVTSGTFSSPNLRVGQKFRDEKEQIYGVDIVPGETYTLEIVSTVE